MVADVRILGAISPTGKKRAPKNAAAITITQITFGRELFYTALASGAVRMERFTLTFGAEIIFVAIAVATTLSITPSIASADPIAIGLVAWSTEER